MSLRGLPVHSFLRVFSVHVNSHNVRPFRDNSVSVEISQDQNEKRLPHNELTLDHMYSSLGHTINLTAYVIQLF